MNNWKKFASLLLFLFILLSPPSSKAAESKCPGGSAPDPNWIFCEDFETWNNQGWSVGSNANKLDAGDFVRNDRKIHGSYGAWTGQQFFDGYWGCYGYDTDLCWGTGLTELYIRWYTYISPNYVFGPDEDKLFLLNDCARTIGPYIYASRPGGGAHGNYGLGIPGASVYQDCDWGQSAPCDGDEWVNRGLNTGNDIILQTGHTYLFEWYIKLNTPGQRNGLMKLWIDDVTSGNPHIQTLRMDWANVRYLGSADVGKTFNSLRLTVYSQRKYADEPSDRYMSWDDIVISTLPIGLISSGDPASPFSPQSLSVR